MFLIHLAVVVADDDVVVVVDGGGSGVVVDVFITQSLIFGFPSLPAFHA